MTLTELTTYCDSRLNLATVADFPGANNGLQIENNGAVRKIGAAVDASAEAIEAAIAEEVDFLIVHHGLFWNTPKSYTGSLYAKLKRAFDSNLALYSAHLPLDAHPEIGNNSSLARVLELEPVEWFLPYEGTPIALLAESKTDADQSLTEKLKKGFPDGFTAIEHGSRDPQRVALLTGSGRSAIPYLKGLGCDTLVTGELRQEHYAIAFEEKLNLYVCGHYATETFGVRALAEELSEKFGLPSTFLPSPCPL
jgi:dinuclear metal center YbgI/SA1388 family protein